MNIYQRLDKVRQGVAYIQKDKAVLNYKAVTHDNVTAQTRPFFIEHGIVIEPQVLNSTTVQDTGRQTSNGTPYIRYEATFDIRFVNIDDPQDVAVVRLTAHADDTGDKAPGKAISYATKYAVLKVLSIETGEDEEAREMTAGYTPRQKEAFDQMIADNDGVSLVIFSQDINQKIWNNLQNSFPEGDKTSGKKRMGKVLKSGWDQIDTYSVQVTELIEEGDNEGIKEIFNDLGDIGKRLVWTRLTPEMQDRAQELSRGKAA